MRYIRQLLILLLALPLISAAQQAGRYDVVITEIMADPSPVVGLPNGEYIEIKNVSVTGFNLNGWRLSDATSTATITANFILQPDSVVILCSNSNVSIFSAFGRTIGVSNFPSLDNNGDLLTLRSPQNIVVHAVSYSMDWYQNELKKDGGWSLEMINPKNPCGGEDNWKASTDTSGGSPGKKNSVDGIISDNTPPQLIRTFSIDSLTVVALFNEPVDSLSASVISNYSLSNNIAITTALAEGPLFSSVVLKLSHPLQKQIIYTLTANNVKDCKGNSVGAFNKAKTGIAEEALSNNVVINEVLFHPRANAYDYVEIYNRSNKIIDANKLYIANRNSSAALSSIKKLYETSFNIFPGDHIVITEDIISLQHEYLVQNSDQVLILSSLPSFPDDKGTVVIVNAQGIVVDEISYSEKWHFALISNNEGVALERIDPDDPSQKQANWHSASSTAGFGTPTSKNSQFKQINTINATIEVSPKIFSPDNDGHDDIATIAYSVSEQGYVANVTIFDASGRLVKRFQKNELLALSGRWNWDGLNENRQKLPLGTYIIYTEIFNLQGKKKQFKNTVVLAKQLK